MLLLDDAHCLDRALVLEILRPLVPPGHVFAAAGSPGCPDVQNELLTSETDN